MESTTKTYILTIRLMVEQPGKHPTSGSIQEAHRGGILENDPKLLSMEAMSMSFGQMEEFRIYIITILPMVGRPGRHLISDWTEEIAVPIGLKSALAVVMYMLSGRIGGLEKRIFISTIQQIMEKRGRRQISALTREMHLGRIGQNIQKSAV